MEDNVALSLQTGAPSYLDGNTSSPKRRQLDSMPLQVLENGFRVLFEGMGCVVARKCTEEDAVLCLANCWGATHLHLQIL